MSHSRWKRKSRDGAGSVKEGFVHCVLVRWEMPGGGLTVPCSVFGILEETDWCEEMIVR